MPCVLNIKKVNRESYNFGIKFEDTATVNHAKDQELH